MNDHLRRGVLFAVPLLCLLVMAVTAIVWAAELPDQVAIHWNLAGEADGFASQWVATAVPMAVAGLLGFGFLTASRRAPAPAARWLGALACGLPLLLAALHLGTLGANYFIGLPEQAELPVVGIAYGIVLLVAGGAVGWRLTPPGDEVVTAQLPVRELEVQPGEAVVWSGRATAEPWLAALAGAIVLAGGWFVLVEELWATGVLVAVGVLVGSLLRVRVSVGPAGVVARSGPFGLLRQRVALAEVARVTAEEVEPLAYGGWGYRVVPGARALIVRSGPGLHVERVDGPALVVTVDGAAEAAGVLRAHLDAAGHPA